jgi:hypothetical protein
MFIGEASLLEQFSLFFFTGQNHTFVFIALISFSVLLNTLKIHELHE